MAAIPIPQPLKSLQPFIKIAKEFERSDLLTSYYCKVFALSEGVKINDKSDPRSKQLLISLMDEVELFKREHKSSIEGLTNDLVAESHIESTAIKLFNAADKADRAGTANVNIIKLFYTSAKLFEVLGYFKEEYSDYIKAMFKYAAWKATYISKCLKTGIVPVPGPAAISGDSAEDDELSALLQQLPGAQPTSSQAAGAGPSQNSVPTNSYTVNPPAAQPARKPKSNIDFEEASKLCKYAQSALTYEDASTAISYLQQAMDLLTPN
jgi:vacuolar protein sorting-associated protein VTA1